MLPQRPRIQFSFFFLTYNLHWRYLINVTQEEEKSLTTRKLLLTTEKWHSPFRVIGNLLRLDCYF